MQSWHGFEVVFKELVAFAFIKLPSQIIFFQTPEKNIWKRVYHFILLEPMQANRATVNRLLNYSVWEYTKFASIYTKMHS